MKNYPKDYKQLVQLFKDLGTVAPDTITAFGSLHKAATKEGVLSKKTKELIALGISITSRCDGCIAFHVHDALKAGATNEELIETIEVAILMGGGPAMIYGCEALTALRQFNLELENSVQIEAN